MVHEFFGSNTSHAEIPADQRVLNPDVAWVTRVEVPGSPDEVWNTLTTMGPQDEGYGGYFVTEPGSVINRLLPTKFQSPQVGESSPRQLQLGGLFPDGHKKPNGQYDLSEVVKLDDDTRTIELETTWTPPEHKSKRVVAAVAAGGLAARLATKESPSKLVRVVTPAIGAAIGGAVAMWFKPRSGEPQQGLHYTTRFEVSEGEVPNTAVITGTNRMANVRHPRIGNLLYPRADQVATRIMGRNIGRVAIHSKLTV